MKITKADVCRCILKILADTEGHPLAQDVLQEHVCARLRPTPTQEAFEAALSEVKASGYVREMPGEMGDASRWVLSEKGQAWLAAKG